MASEKNKLVLTDQEEEFLQETKLAIAASGAKILLLNSEVEKLKKEIEKTNKELRAFL